MEITITTRTWFEVFSADYVNFGVRPVEVAATAGRQIVIVTEAGTVWGQPSYNYWVKSFDDVFGDERAAQVEATHRTKRARAKLPNTSDPAYWYGKGRYSGD